MKTWQGRFGSPSSREFDEFTSSVAQDALLAPYDIRISKAHARALVAAGLLSRDEMMTIVDALDQIADSLDHGLLEWRDDLEDVHTHVEVWLREMVGDLANKLHAGRSRNDQVATDLRLFTLDACAATQERILNLQESLLNLARRYRDDVMPGYTHLQQAQPVSIAYPLLAYAAMLSRDWRRFSAVSGEARRSPLGSGALAGSTLPLDRDLLAAEVGLSRPVENSLDAVSDRDFLVDFVSAAALCMTHLSRLAEDMTIWSSVEFAFVALPDAFASGSSMMPQKKNPDVFELVRGKTATVLGDATAVLALVKALPMGYNRDLQEDKTPLFHSSATLNSCLAILAPTMAGIEFDTDRCAAAISSFAGATDLAEHLVAYGVPFRDAHYAVGACVAKRMSQGRGLDDVMVDELDLAVRPQDLPPLPSLSPADCVARRVTAGSPGRVEIDRQIAGLAQRVSSRREADVQ